MKPDDPGPQRFPTPFQRKTLWAALTGLAIVVIGAIAILGVWLSGKILAVLQPVLVPLAVAGIIAYLLEPIVQVLTRRGQPRRRAVILVFVSFHAMILLLVLSVVPASIGQAYELEAKLDQTQTAVVKGIASVESRLKAWRDGASGGFVSQMIRKIFPTNSEASPAAEEDPDSPPESPPSEDQPAPPAQEESDPPSEPPPPEEEIDWEPLTMRLVAFVKQSYSDLIPKVWNFITGSIQGVFGFFGYLLGLFLVPIYLYYFLAEARAISDHWTDYVPLKASRFKDEVVGTLSEINGYLIAFFRGQMMVSLIDGVLIAICLQIIGMPYAILIGVFVALLGLIPYIGNLLCLIPAVLISIAHFSAEENQVFGITQLWAYPLLVVAIFTVTQQINSLVTAPRIVGDSVGLHPLTVIFSVFFWSILMGGLLGSLLAVPLTASIKVLFRRYIWETRVMPQMPHPGADSGG